MLVIMWLTLFVVASATLHQTLTRRLPNVLGALLGIILWIVLAFGALDLVVIGMDGVAFTDESQPLAFLCLGGVVVNGVFIFAGFFDWLPVGSPAQRGGA